MKYQKIIGAVAGITILAAVPALVVKSNKALFFANALRDSLTDSDTRSVLDSSGILAKAREQTRGVAAAAPQTTSAYQPAILKSLLESVELKAKAGKTPVVLFDLDDTLMDAAYRQMAIVKEISRQAEFQRRFPDDARKMEAVQYKDARWDLAGTLQALGVTSPAAGLPELAAFWSEHFFDESHLLLDKANPGAASYVREVVRRGGLVIYLTGRWEEMRPGTVGSLKQEGFPEPDGRNVRLMMKPRRDEKDIDFKRRAFDEIAALGEVVGGFENEPQNVNAFQERFSGGFMIFLDTRHSHTMTVPLPSVFWVKDFRY